MQLYCNLRITIHQQSENSMQMHCFAGKRTRVSVAGAGMNCIVDVEEGIGDKLLAALGQ